ncbi:MAG: thermonuclease family protein [Polyangiales bacterium]
MRAALLLPLVLAACSSKASAPVDEGASGDSGEEVAIDTGAAEVASDAPKSACPEPATIGLADVPAGFLPPEDVNLAYDVDGDTAHFYFKSGEQIVRFLFVNTEEVVGTEKTVFGQQSKDAVKAILEKATKIVVVVREGTTKGMPDLDPYMRWLGMIFVDGELLETRIVREGWTAYYTKYGCAPGKIHDSLLYAEAEAFAAQRGVWEPGHPTDYKPILVDWGAAKCGSDPYAGPLCK